MLGDNMVPTAVLCVRVRPTFRRTDGSSTTDIFEFGQTQQWPVHWALLLQPFRFTVEAIPGSENVGADYLSRI